MPVIPHASSRSTSFNITAAIPRGSFGTPAMTDVKTDWTVHFALMNKASAWVIQAIDKAFSLLPMGLKDIHSDTGSELSTNPLLNGAASTISSSAGNPISRSEPSFGYA